MPKIKYDIWCSLDIGESIESVGEVLKELNGILKDSGLTQELKYVSRFRFGVITVNHKLSKEQLSDMRTLIGGEIMKSPLSQKYRLRLESITESSQSCSQSYNATNVTNAQ